MTDPAGPAGALARIVFRRPEEADHRRLVDRVDHWFGGRSTRPLLGRFWLMHFASTSLVGETLDPRSADPRSRRIVAFLVGFASPDRAGEAVIHLAAVAPEWRRRGFGTAMHDRWLAEMEERGARRAIVVVPPDERVAVLFYRSLGFEPEIAGTRPLWGVPAFADYEGDGGDRAILTRPLGPP